MAIAGGALASLQGKVGDLYGLHWGFLVTAGCALYVLSYALWGCKVPADVDLGTERNPAEALAETFE
jgi:FHS family L-fucose permease-like MFS transporter